MSGKVAAATSKETESSVPPSVFETVATPNGSASGVAAASTSIVTATPDAEVEGTTDHSFGRAGSATQPTAEAVIKEDATDSAPSVLEEE